MSRPTRLEILDYALEGLRMYYGTFSGQFDDDEEKELKDHADWLERQIERVKQREERALSAPAGHAVKPAPT